MGSTIPCPAAQSQWSVQAAHFPQHEQHAVTARFALFSQLVAQQIAGLEAIITSYFASRMPVPRACRPARR